MKKVSKLNSKDNIFYWLMLALPLLQFVVFYIYVNINSVALAFQRHNPDGTFSFAFVENFKRIFNEIKTGKTQEGYNYIVAIRNSVQIFLLSALVATPLAMFFSYYFL